MVRIVDKTKVPWWVSNVIIPLVNLTLAFIVSGLFIFIAGENPYQALKLILYGSFGYFEGLGYTLYYATNFIFTGLAFAVAFHCRLFNIGGEGQAYIGGLGVFLIAFYFSALPVPIVWLLAILASMLFGAIAAIGQKNLKRLVAYSSIGHMGYALAGVSTGTNQGIQSSITYISIYLFMNLAFFSCLFMLRRDEKYFES